jgi:hypothetical protein
VTHLDVDDAGIRQAVEALRQVTAARQRWTRPFRA